MNSQKSKFLTMFLALLPGAGHMYLGYMRRGCSFLILFFAACALASLIGFVGFAIPIVWVFSFFDTYNLRTQYITTGEINDSWLFNVEELKINNKGKAARYVGGGLVFLGVLGMWDVLQYQISDFLKAFNIDPSFLYHVPNIIVCIAIIIIGFKLIFGKKEGK